MAAVALTSAGLVVGGVAVVSQLASAGEPSIVPGATPRAGDERVAAAPDTTTPDTTTPDSAPPATAEPDHGEGPVLDGQITIDIGSGEPITLDLGEIGECIDLPIFGPGEGGWPALPEIGRVPGPRGDHVVVVGSDGVSVLDFGEGDGSVTITKSGDEITVDSDGDVTTIEPDQVLHELPDISIPPLPDLPDLAEIQDCVSDLGL
jgi:hypothetical protein